MFISVIIPLYNAEKFIKNTLDSILTQEYTNFEIIVVDDESTDNSAQIVKGYEEKYSQIKLISQKNSGAPMARNKGLSLAEGEYILFLDSDDLLSSSSFLQVNAVIKDEKDYDLIIGDYSLINNSGEAIGIKVNNKFKNIQNANDFTNLSQIDPLPGTKYFKKSFLDNYDLVYSEVKVGQDLNFFLKVLGHNPSVKLIKSNVLKYRIHETGISRTYNEKLLGIIDSLNEIEALDFDLFKTNNLLDVIKMNHYSIKLYKVPFIKERETRKNVYQKLVKEINNLQTQQSFRTKYSIKLDTIYTSNIFSKVYSLLFDLKNLSRNLKQ